MGSHEQHNEMVTIACKIVRETEKAYLINDGSRKDVWVPKSQCKWEPSDAKDEGEMEMPEWIAKDKGLI